MSTVPRRSVLLGAAGAGAAAVGSTTASALTARAMASPSKAAPVFAFASLPDFFNGDVGDLSVLPDWDGGLNSINQAWTDAIAKCLGRVAAHQPDAVFLGGDMVEGRWNLDTDNRELFGPVRQGIDPESIAMCEAAISSAGDLYYSYHAGLFSSRGLSVYPAVGDHELLDDRSGPINDRWSPSGTTNGVPDNRYYLVEHCKDVWASHFTRRPGGTARFARRPKGTPFEWTAYAVSFADSLTLITVDMFTRQPGGVRLGVFGSQLRWLTAEIRRAKRQGHTVVVQGHVPVLTPARWLLSGRLHVPEGRSSAIYRVLEREGVDLFLCGEVHDSTALQRGRGSLVQISHGCIFRYAFSFLIGRLYPDHRLVLDLYEMPVLRASREHLMWSTDARKRQRTYIEYGDPVHRGRLVQRHRQVLKRTAKLGTYHRLHDIYALRNHLGTVMF
jgi:3',5'-cyclic AMP phosphodiesterase CpdA